MNITYQYYNEIVLAFADYEIDYNNGVIIIEVPDSKKPFESVCSKIKEQINRIAETLEPRDREIIVKVVRVDESAEINLDKEEHT